MPGARTQVVACVSCRWLGLWPITGTARAGSGRMTSSPACIVGRDCQTHVEKTHIRHYNDQDDLESNEEMEVAQRLQAPPSTARQTATSFRMPPDVVPRCDNLTETSSSPALRQTDGSQRTPIPAVRGAASFMSQNIPSSASKMFLTADGKTIYLTPTHSIYIAQF